MDYEWADVGDSTAYVGGQVAYIGDRMRDFGNRRRRTANSVIADAYTTLDLRTGSTGTTWSVELYGKNLTDERGITDIIAPASPFPAGAGATRRDPAAHDRPLDRRRGSDGPAAQGERLVGSPHLQRP